MIPSDFWECALCGAPVTDPADALCTDCQTIQATMAEETPR